LHRSVLFTPATQLEKVVKARESGCDWLALDLEDGVGAKDKAAARDALSSLANEGFDGESAKTAVRINPLSTPDGIKDLAAMLGWDHWPEMVILPKVESAQQIDQIRQLGQSIGKNPFLFAVFETAFGVHSAADILRDAGPKVIAGYGSADHTAQTGATMNDAALAWARGQIVNAAAIANIPVLDGVWLDFKDHVGLKAEAELVRDLGFSGKIAIHPDQIPTINTVFSPSAEEIAIAHEMIAAFDKAGGGAFSFKGKMVDLPVLARARRIIDMKL
jgi:citrate lyase beta subunit